MYGACSRCWTSLQTIWEWFTSVIWRWISVTWRQCTEQRCIWWCLCCNKWFCWIALIVILVVSVIVMLIVTVILVVVCIVASLWCVICATICWLGCFGRRECVDNCVRGCGSSQVTVSVPINGGGGVTPTPATPAPDATESPTAGESHGNDPGSGNDASPPPSSSFGDGGRARLADDQAWHGGSSLSCGCREGKIGGMIAGLGSTVVLVGSQGGVESLGWAAVGIIFGALVAGAVVGKLFGILRSWLELRRSRGALDPSRLVTESSKGLALR
jgi:hypothetical protein